MLTPVLMTSEADFQMHVLPFYHVTTRTGFEWPVTVEDVLKY